MAWVPIHPGAQRFYHSQQLAPVFEVPPASGLDIYDVYQFAGGYSNGAPRSKLLEAKHTPYYYNNNISSHNHNLAGQFSLRNGSRLERSQSDAKDRSSPRRDHRRQPSRQSSASSNENRARAGSKDSEEARRQRASKSIESLRENGAAVPVIPVSSGGASRASSKTGGDSLRTPSSESHSSGGAHVNAGYVSVETHQSSGKTRSAPSPSISAHRGDREGQSIPNGTRVISSAVPDGQSSKKSSARSDSTATPSLSASATDSMKLLSKNKTDDQKTTSPVATIVVDKSEDDLGKPSNFQRYEYAGDLYTRSSKGVLVSDRDEEDKENPIINRMKQMVIEKTRSNPSSPRAEVINTSKSSSLENGVYEEITKITKVTRSEIIESVGPEDSTDLKRSTGGQDTVDLLDGLVLPGILETDSKKKNEPSSPRSPKSSNKPTALLSPPPESVSMSASSPGESSVPSPTSPMAFRSKDALSPRASEADDINKAGKRITASAFEFLEQYLSDDDGTEASHMDSPPLSPTGIRPVGDLVY